MGQYTCRCLPAYLPSLPSSQQGAKKIFFSISIGSQELVFCKLYVNIPWSNQVELSIAQPLKKVVFIFGISLM